jgi:hypothetical protein
MIPIYALRKVAGDRLIELSAIAVLPTRRLPATSKMMPDGIVLTKEED